MTTVERLLAERNLPALLKFKSRKKVRSASDFEARREEIKEILKGLNQKYGDQNEEK